MLPDISLDKDNFDDIVEEARNMIISLYPEWTDFNFHDPGITLIELFAWLKDIQQYHIDYVGERNQLKYLKLLGIERSCMVPAKARIRIETLKDMILPRGTQIYASEVCFETMETKFLTAGDIKECFTKNKEIISLCDRRMLSFGNKMRTAIFGMELKPGTEFYIGFDRKLPVERMLSIYFDIFNEYEVKRNPVKGSQFTAMCKLKYEYFTEAGWRTLEVTKDETFGFLQSGNLYFAVATPMAELELEEERGYFIRVCLEEHHYDVPPVLQTIRMNTVEVCQMKHLMEERDILANMSNEGLECFVDSALADTGYAEVFEKYLNGYRQIEIEQQEYIEELGATRFLIGKEEKITEKELKVLMWDSLYGYKRIAGIGTGLPFQEIKLNIQEIVKTEIRLMVEDVESEGCYIPWKQVADFDTSTAADYHYILDERQGILKFGDCIHGAAPEGKILITNLALSKGSEGNVKSDKINKFEEERYETLRAVNEKAAEGGSDIESMEHCFLSAKRQMSNEKYLVTYEDYETCVRSTPGLMIETCKVVQPMKKENDCNYGKSNIVTIVVKPYSFEKKPKLSAIYQRNITDHLERQRLLGTKINLIAPEYIKLTIYTEVVSVMHNRYENEQIMETLKQYLKPYSKNFGRRIMYSDIYMVLGKLKFISEVKSLNLDIKGNDVERTINGDILLPPNGILCLEEIEYEITVYS